MVAVGTSDAWVTGYAGTALAAAARSGHLPPAVRAAAAEGADAAADWLLGAAGARGVWGYHGNVAPDADSTAWAVRLLAARGRPVPQSALTFLAEHESDTGYRTYADVYRAGHWSEPTPDVSAAALLARYEAGTLDRAELAAGWTKLIAGWLRPPGRWTSIWWAEDGYPTVLALEAWAVAGRPGLAPVPAPVRPPTTAFGHAVWLHAYALTDGPADAHPLLSAERPTGGWGGDAELLVPDPSGGGINERSLDARGVFTTATALRALLAAGPDLPAGDFAGPPQRSEAGLLYDRVIATVAADIGLDPDRAAAVFAELTRETFTAPAPWPSAQLSGLAGGLPLELSATDGPPALRYTVEIGNPVLPAYARALSGLEALGRTAALLDCTAAWTAARPAVEAMVHPALPVPEGCRFWVWAGADASPAGGEVLKVYLSSLHHDLADGRALERVAAALQRLGLPPSAPAFSLLNRLEGYGFCQELGLGLAPDGRLGVKVYYEVAGWQPDLVAAVLADAGLPADPALVAPVIPGVMNEEVAATRRAGIALRISPTTGAVTEVTTAAAFMRPMIGNNELARRVSAWLTTTGDARTFNTMAARVRPGWTEWSPRMHGLFTRTLSAAGTRNTVYLRPPLQP
ncbi:hypothetical protein [Dactylosporangium sp. NPDC051541]|uniref:hypothetical protein n=1 Tax=Dactylosporangium sp. NPDC051541 TaxID=3363977 RepID=UPI00379FDB9D